ncbi:hypothetical protein C8R45DRAFT_983538 [Mycena sanguinolenta]|nr:hypothetical protein C8R45DRAFT_983538 [Mycena sanguinolenta]
MRRHKCHTSFPPSRLTMEPVDHCLVLLDELCARARYIPQLAADSSPRKIAKRHSDLASMSEKWAQVQQLLDVPSHPHPAPLPQSQNSENPGQADNAPAPQPPAKETTVERTQRLIGERIQRILPDEDVGPEDYLDATDFEVQLTQELSMATAADKEDDGLRRLIRGHADTPDQWEDALHHLSEGRASWDTACAQSIANNAISNDTQRLLAVHKEWCERRDLDRAVFYVDYVVRQVDVIYFMTVWESHDSDQEWKTKFFEQAFRLDRPKLYASIQETTAGSRARNLLEKSLQTDLTRYKRDYGRAIAQRKTILRLYRMFGPGVFLDTLWETIGPNGPSQPVKRSTEFTKLVRHLCNVMPNSPQKSCLLPVSRYEWTADSLYRVLEILTGSTVVSEYVREFMVQHPPTAAEDATFHWGLREPEEEPEE